jgi:hypothetical protein
MEDIDNEAERGECEAEELPSSKLENTPMKDIVRYSGVGETVSEDFQHKEK